MKTLSIKKATISAIIVWILGVAAYAGSYFIPIMDDPDLQANWVLSITLVPAAALGAHLYFRRGYRTNGLLLGSFMFLAAMLLDACITVPLFIIPNGGDHLSFFGDPGFWLIGLEYITVVTAYWLIRKSTRFNKINFSAIVLTFSLIISCSNDDEFPTPVNGIYLSIPDIHFESKLIELGIDSDSVINHQILKSDAEKVTHLDLNLSSNSGKISDLTGIEGFINITFLSVAGQEIQDINLSFNTELDTLFLGGNILTSIDISKNPNLILLDIQANYLHTINGLSNAENLKKVNFSFNDFEEVSIDNESVEVLLMSHNLLRSIDVKGALSLKNVLLTSNQLTTIDLSTNTLLETLMISDNNLSNIHLEHNINLTHLYISSNSLTGLDVSNNQALTDLRVDRNPDLTCIKILSNQEIPTLSLSEYQELNELCN